MFAPDYLFVSENVGLQPIIIEFTEADYNTILIVHTLATRMVCNWYHRQVNNCRLYPYLRTVLFSFIHRHTWLTNNEYQSSDTARHGRRPHNSHGSITSTFS